MMKTYHGTCLASQVPFLLGNARMDALSLCSSVPYDIEGGPFFAESAVLVLRSEQRVGLQRCQQLPLYTGTMIDHA